MTATAAPLRRLPSLRARLLLCLACAPLAARAREIATYDCIDPGNRGQTHVVRRGEPTTLCLYVGPGGDWNRNISYKRFSVNLVADEFSNYQIPGSFKSIVGEVGESRFNVFNHNSTHVFAASQSSLSFLRRYYDQTTQLVYPYLTAIVDVKDGVVLGITWDDACVFCERSQCRPNTYNLDGSAATAAQSRQPVDGCPVTEAACEGFRLDGSHVCDLRLHVVWTGTDANGKALLSSDSRFSMFPPSRIQERVQGRLDSMVENLNNMKEKIPGMG